MCLFANIAKLGCSVCCVVLCVCVLCGPDPMEGFLVKIANLGLGVLGVLCVVCVV